jgi:hypothetical protein
MAKILVKFKIIFMFSKNYVIIPVFYGHGQ